MQKVSLALTEIVRVKTFLDRVKCDEAYRSTVFSRPENIEVLEGVPSTELRSLWELGSGLPHTPIALEFLEFYEKVKGKLPATPKEPDHPRMRAWRKRQQSRLSLQLGPFRANQIGHFPAVFELSKGCSVGCWFCGVSAAKLARVWEYTPENRECWRQLLTSLREFVGPALGWGFCYWASDPLDNPDYEKFALDFHELLGHFPTITTALALKDVERTRRLLRTAGELSGNGLHFSLLGPKQYERVCQSFAPEELLEVDMVPQYAKSSYHLAYSGRARQRERGSGVDQNPNTIACVSGFLLNLVEQQVQLITPCPATAEDPDGYQVLAVAHYTDQGQFKELLQSWAEQHMRLSVLELPTLKLVAGLEIQGVPQGFRVVGPGQCLDYQNPNHGPCMELVGELIAEACHSAEQVALLAAFQRGAPESLTLNILETLFGYGIFEEYRI